MADQLDFVMDGSLAAIDAGLVAEAAAGQPPLPDFTLIELFFFAYRDFIADPDRVLAPLSFGRAHHRVLHFVGRRPGLTIAELLDILRITKQSLGRVLKDLLEAGYVTATPGESDRRQRRLFLSASGRTLTRQLSDAQTQRFSEALAKLPAGARDGAIAFLTAMVGPEGRSAMARIPPPEAGR